MSHSVASFVISIHIIQRAPDISRSLFSTQPNGWAMDVCVSSKCDHQMVWIFTISVAVLCAMSCYIEPRYIKSLYHNNISIYAFAKMFLEWLLIISCHTYFNTKCRRIISLWKMNVFNRIDINAVNSEHLLSLLVSEIIPELIRHGWLITSIHWYRRINYTSMFYF